MTEGVVLEFKSNPPLLSIYPPPWFKPSQGQLSFIREKVFNLLAEGWSREVPFPIPMFFSRLFLVSKRENWRMIIELHAFNAFLVHKHFKMSTPTCVTEAILVSMWGGTLDFQNTYLKVSMALYCQIYLGL